MVIHDQVSKIPSLDYQQWKWLSKCPDYSEKGKVVTVELVPTYDSVCRTNRVTYRVP